MVVITNNRASSSSSLAKTTTTTTIIKLKRMFLALFTTLLMLLITTSSSSSVVLAFSSSSSSHHPRSSASVSKIIISSRSTNNHWSIIGGRRRNNYNHGSPLSTTPSIVRPNHPRYATTSTSLHLLGSDSGLLGVGAPEVAVILLVGYFVLGPSDLYKLVKEIGKFIQNARTLGAEAAKSFEGTMEDQLELKELRRAQSELNEAFRFRRSINTSEFGEAFDRRTAGGGGAILAATTTDAAAAATTGGLDGSSSTVAGGEEVEETGAPKRKRKLVRRKKKKLVDTTANEIDLPSSSESESERGGYDSTNFALEYPDLDMLDSVMKDDINDNGDDLLLRAQRTERLQQSSAAETTTSGSAASNEAEEMDDMVDWFTASEKDIASKILNQPDNTSNKYGINSFEKQRFQSQLSAEEWNAQIMAKEDELSPLSMVMQRLAILEEEKRAADKRIEEEYMRRLDNEDKYYLEKRNVLLEAITDIQEGVYGNNIDDGGGGSDEKEEEKDRWEKDKGEEESSSSTSAKVDEDDDYDNDDDDDLHVKEEINANKKMTA